MAQSKEMIQELDECFFKTAANIIKYFDESGMKELLDELRSSVEDNCIETAKMEIADDIKKSLISQYQDKNMKNIIKDYKTAISEIEVDPSKDKRLIEYDHQVEKIYSFHVNQTTSDNALVDTDADLQLTGTDINVIDPISKMRMTDPVKNIICGHVYDRESVTAMLKKNKNTRCPVIGCSNMKYINLNECRIDIVTKMYLEQNPA